MLSNRYLPVFALGITLVLMSWAGHHAQAATINVPADFTTIQGAIADAGTVNGDCHPASPLDLPLPAALLPSRLPPRSPPQGQRALPVWVLARRGFSPLGVFRIVGWA